MNPSYFGDSYDLAKRFFCQELALLGYTVSVDAMLTGDWNGTEQQFYQLIGARPTEGQCAPSALFVDPDTGVHSSGSRKHITYERMAELSLAHRLVFSFDQSFSRQHVAKAVMERKLARLQSLGCHAMYYDSHARFLFTARQQEPIQELRSHLLLLGMPASRLVAPST